MIPSSTTIATSNPINGIRKAFNYARGSQPTNGKALEYGAHLFTHL